MIWMSHASREARTRSVPARPGLAGRGLRLACILAGVFHAIASDHGPHTPDGPFSYVKNSLVVTGKDMKRTLRETPEKPKSTKFWRSSV